MQDGSDNRWFSWFDKTSGWWEDWAHISTFVQRARDSGWMPAHIAQMQSAIDTPLKKLQLGLEFHLAVTLGKPLYSVTYNMERYGLVSAFTFLYFTTVDQHMTALQAAGANSAMYQLLEAWAQGHRYGQIAPFVASQTVRDVWALRLAHITYWKDSIKAGMKRWIELFRGFSLLHPLTVVQVDDVLLQTRLDDLMMAEHTAHAGEPRFMTGIKGFDAQQRAAFIADWPQYRKLCAQYGPTFSAIKADEQPMALWRWHWSLRLELPGVYFVAESGALCQPSSADIERFFSRLKASTTDLMTLEHDETLETRAFCMYNK
jgi:hypothetical protein